MSSVTFSVPVLTGANSVTSADLVKNSGTWSTHSSATASNSLDATLGAIAAQIPSLNTTSATTGITDLNSDSTTEQNGALTRAVDVKGALDALVDGAPGALNTLNELATALNDDADFAATLINTTLPGKAAVAGSSTQAFAASTLSASAIAEHSGTSGLTIGKHSSVANGDTWIEFDSDNHVLIKGQNAAGSTVTLVTFAA